MVDEFERIMEFFSLSPEEKEERLEEVFEESVEYFERFKHIMMHGSPEEKKQAFERVKIMRQRIEEETQRVCDKTGMTEEQLTQFSNDPKHFSSEQWVAIENAKARLRDGVEDVKQVMNSHSSEVKSAEGAATVKKGTKSGKKRRKAKNWLPS